MPRVPHACAKRDVAGKREIAAAFSLTDEKTSRLERVKKFILEISIPAYGLRGRAVQP